MKTMRKGRLHSIGGYIRRVAPSNLKRAWLFGSCVKGPWKAARDIDLLVQAIPGLSLMEAAGLKISLEKKLGRRVDVISRKYLHPVLRPEIETTKVLIYEKH